MTNRELDALVAERVMGCRVAWNAAPYCDCSVDRPHDIATDDDTFELPLYSTDIAAAWEVVEKIIARGNNVWVGFYGNTWHMHFTEDALSQYPADTAPKAICLAALQVMDVQQ